MLAENAVFMYESITFSKMLIEKIDLRVFKTSTM